MGLLSTIGAASGRAFGLSRLSAAVKDTYFNLVTLLLPGNGTNGAQNNTFLDSSSNNFTITRNGNTTQGTFSPFSQTGWSNFFDGSGDNLSVPAGSAFAYGTQAFTVEAWVFPTASASQIILSQTVSGTNYFVCQLNTSNQPTFIATLSGGGTEIVGSTAVTLNQWNHIAWVREGTGSNQFKIYLNGTSVATSTVSIDLTNTTYAPTIGQYTHSATLNFTGYISNLRVTKGGALYTSNFTPSITPLTTTVSAGTVSLLTCQSNRFIDNSANTFAVSVGGNTSVQAFSPFLPGNSYDTATNGGAAFFDGTGDYLSLPDNTAFSGIGSNDWTVEAWVYTGSSASQTIFTISGSSSAFAAIRLELSATANQMYLLCSLAGSAWDINYQAGTIPRNAWNHVAATRSGTSVRLYVNGAQVGVTQTLSGSLMSGTVNRVGIVSDNVSNPFNGYISNARYIRGTALYTGTTYTIPTAPLTAITNTQLLLNFTNAGITDATAKNVLETVGNAQISTTQSKFGGSSMYFDGTGDGLDIRDTELLEFGNGNFTVEGWVRFAALPGNTGIAAIVGKWDGSSQKSWYMYIYNNGGTYQLYFSYTTNGSTNVNPAANVTISTNTWYHIAACRDGANLRMFVDGTQVGSTYNIATDTIFGGTYPAQVGRVAGTHDLNGYIDDLRITKGYARYTSNFTAPTAAFPLQ